MLRWITQKKEQSNAKQKEGKEMKTQMNERKQKKLSWENGFYNDLSIEVQSTGQTNTKRRMSTMMTTKYRRERMKKRNKGEQTLCKRSKQLYTP